jgi:hypothetical protein
LPRLLGQDGIAGLKTGSTQAQADAFSRSMMCLAPVRRRDMMTLAFVTTRLVAYRHDECPRWGCHRRAGRAELPADWEIACYSNAWHCDDAQIDP